MRLSVIAMGMMLLVACGDKKAPETPSPSPVPSGVEKTSTGTPPPVVSAEVKAEDKPVEVKPEDKPVEVKPEDKPVEVKPEDKPVEVKPEDKPAEPEVKPEEVEAQPEPEEKAPEPEAEGATAIAPDLVVADSAVTSAVVDRMPSDRKTSWKIGEDSRLIGWFELKNPGSAVDLELVWTKDGKENWRFPTNVGTGKNWRTWAEKRIGKRDAGSWKVELVDSNGHVYGSLSYTVE